MDSKQKNIVLIGFMGSGKTTIGIKLSYRLKMSVSDTDKMIEARENRKIADIFAEQGEAYFRATETSLLRQLASARPGKIYSLGGGTPLREENQTILRSIGTVIYLRIKPETVMERLKDDTTRPLLQCANPEQKIKTLLAERDPVYEKCADIVIDVDDRNADDIVDQIVKEIKPMKILVINGPNINFLGIREKAVYGTCDYQYLLDMIQKKAEETDNDITVFQSNHEGAIIDRIQESYFDGTGAIVINPGAYTHYSYAIRDALASIQIPKVEIHISDITQREEFRKISVTAPACDKQIYGQGLDGYLQAIDFVIQKMKQTDGI